MRIPEKSKPHKVKTNQEKFKYLIDKSDVKFFKANETGNEYEMLQIDAIKFNECLSNNGGYEVFG